MFDMDGTVADTEALVKQSYELVGVKMPSDAWGVQHREWLPDIVGAENAAETIRLKNIAYRVLVTAHGVEQLAAAHLARTLSELNEYDVSILTGASFDAAYLVRHAVKLSNIPFLSVGASLDEKIDALNRLGESGLYFDDNLHACEEIEKRTQWTVLYVTRDSSLDDVMKAFKEAHAGEDLLL